jgi:hypothetical protein
VSCCHRCPSGPALSLSLSDFSYFSLASTEKKVTIGCCYKGCVFEMSLLLFSWISGEMTSKTERTEITGTKAYKTWYSLQCIVLKSVVVVSALFVSLGRCSLFQVDLVMDFQCMSAAQSLEFSHF